MISSVKSFILSAFFSVSALAQPYANTDLNLNQTLEKFDYMLTSHPMAHDDQFKAKTLAQMKQEIRAVVEASSTEELIKSFNILIEQIPQSETREAYLRVLETSSPEDLELFLASPELMSEALIGEGANFSLTTGSGVLDASIFLLSAVAFVYIANRLFVSESTYEPEIYMGGN